MKHRHWRRQAAFLCLLWFGLLCVGLRAEAPPREPVNLLVNEGFARGEAGWTVPDTDTAYSELVPALAGPYRQALRVTVNPAPGDRAWDVTLRQDVQTPLHKGDPLALKVWLRSPQSLTIGAYVEQGGDSYAKFVSGSLTLTPSWKEYEVRGAADADYPTGKSDAIFHLGGVKGVVEVTGVRLFNPDAPATLQISSGATPDRPVSLIENGDFTLGAAPPGRRSERWKRRSWTRNSRRAGLQKDAAADDDAGCPGHSLDRAVRPGRPSDRGPRRGDLRPRLDAQPRPLPRHGHL